LQITGASDTLLTCHSGKSHYDLIVEVCIGSRVCRPDVVY
jgi:hypothetical protein